MGKDYTGWIVQASAGRDKGGVFCVVGMDREGFLLLADGKRRSAGRPKRKKLRHVRALSDCRGGEPRPAIEKLRRGEAPSDRELRRTLAAFRDEREA